MTGQVAVPVAIGAATAASWVARNSPPSIVVSTAANTNVLRIIVTYFRVSNSARRANPGVRLGVAPCNVGPPVTTVNRYCLHPAGMPPHSRPCPYRRGSGTLGHGD